MLWNIPPGTFKLLATDQVMVFCHRTKAHQLSRANSEDQKNNISIEKSSSVLPSCHLNMNVRRKIECEPDAGVCVDAVWAEEGLAPREGDPRLQG